MILAIDPGGATGVAVLGPEGKFDTVTVGSGFDGMSDWLAAVPWTWVEAVIYENFIPRPGAKSQQLDALHIIGAIKHECRQRGIPCIMQTPTQAKSFSDNAKLKAVGWYTVGADHERDAARHMLIYMAHGNPAPQYGPERTRILDALVAM